MLWKFALVEPTYRMNNLHVDMNGKTPEMEFSDTIGSTTWLSYFHIFGCPVYILDARLQIVGGGGLYQMVSSSSSHNISRLLSISCWKRCIGYESQGGFVISTI